MFRRIHVFSLVGSTALLAATLGGASSAMAAPQAGAAAGETAFTGSAYGTEVTVSPGVATSGRSALSTLGCTSTAGITHTNTVASVTTPVLGTGTIDTSTASQATDTGVASVSSATTEGASLLGGLVSATTIESVSTTSLDTSTGTFSTSSAGTEFLGLTVAGTPITETPAPNTEETLPGVGYVILNQQSGHIGMHQAGMTVIGLHLVVTESTPLAAVGTNIIVSYAHSDLGGPVVGLLDGRSYGAKATVAGTVIAGEEFPQPLACLGTGGITVTNMGAGLSAAGELSSGTVTDTVEGVAQPRHASAEVTSTVQNLNLGSGVVTATAVEADVTATGNPPTLGDNSTFLGLEIDGTPYSDTPAPNTSVPLSGIGTLWLHKVHKTADSITVIMVQLDVTVPSNPLGLAAGTVINVAYATVSIH